MVEETVLWWRKLSCGGGNCLMLEETVLLCRKLSCGGGICSETVLKDDEKAVAGLQDPRDHPTVRQKAAGLPQAETEGAGEGLQGKGEKLFL